MELFVNLCVELKMMIMRRLIFVAIVMLCAGVSGAQTYTQRWNDIYRRTEYYDSNGRMIGYAKYNDVYDRMEYFDANGNLF